MVSNGLFVGFIDDSNGIVTFQQFEQSHQLTFLPVSQYPPRSTMTSMQCIVSRAFEATDDNTLSLASGTVLDIVSDLNPDWWYVKSVHDGKVGYFPSTCCLRFATEKPLPPGWQKHMNPDNRKSKSSQSHSKS